ncbi:unnamed protein product [Prunus brigantina]
MALKKLWSKIHMYLLMVSDRVLMVLYLGLHMQSTLCNYILIMEATTIGSKFGIYFVAKGCLLLKVMKLLSILSVLIPKKMSIPRSRTQYKDHSNQYCVVYWPANPGPNPAIISKVPCYIIYFTTYFTGELKPGQKEDLELPLFDLAAVVCATKNFSNNNKLGEGGFGSVFKVNFFNFGLQTFSQSQCSKNGARRTARRALGGWAGLLGRLGHFPVPNKEDEAAKT